MTMTKTILWISFVLAVCLPHTAAWAGEQDRIENRIMQFLTKKHRMVEALEEMAAEYEYYGSKRGVTRKDRQCLFGLASDMDYQLGRLHDETDGITYQDYVAYREDNPEDARDWAQEILELYSSILAAMKESVVKSQNDCMSFED